jgi:hypothetical protein
MPSDIDHVELLAQAGKSENPVDVSRSAYQPQAPVLNVGALGCIAYDVKTGSIDEAQLTQIQDDQRSVSQSLPQMPSQYRHGRKIQFAGKPDPRSERSVLNRTAKRRGLRTWPS